jgi:hypothetical protein
MPAQIASRPLFRVWILVLAGPLAWGTSLVTMFWLTHPVCQGHSRSMLVLTGVACVAISLAATVFATRFASTLDEVSRFLARLAFWGGLVFSLVIALSLVPTALLTPCPV